MKAFDIFKKTMIFVWMRLGINLAVSAGVILWTIMWIAIASASENGFMIILAVIAIALSGKIVSIIMQYIGYMIKSAQIAVIAEIFQTGRIPNNMVEFGKEEVDGSSPLNSSSINHIATPFARNCERRYFYLKLRLRHLLRQTYKKINFIFYMPQL